MHATARTLVDRPIEDVWAYVADVEHLADWVDGVSDVRPPADDPVVAGSTFSSRYAYRGETFDVEYEVTAADPPRRLDLRSTAGPFPFAGSLRLAEVEGGTEVSNTLEAGSDGLATSVIFAVLGPVVRRLMRRQLARELEALASAVERGDAAAPPGASTPDPAA